MDRSLVEGTLPIPGIHFPEQTAGAGREPYLPEGITTTCSAGADPAVRWMYVATLPASGSDRDSLLLKSLLTVDAGFWPLVQRVEGRLDEVSAGPDDLVRELRDAVGLPMESLANAVGVSRRTPYNWIETGQARPELRARLAELAEILRPLCAAWTKRQVDSWLHSGSPSPLKSLEQRDFGALRSAVAGALGSSSVRKARRLSGTAVGVDAAIDALSAEETAAVLRSLSERSHRTLSASAWQPRELTDSEAQ